MVFLSLSILVRLWEEWQNLWTIWIILLLFHLILFLFGTNICSPRILRKEERVLLWLMLLLLFLWSFTWSLIFVQIKLVRGEGIGAFFTQNLQYYIFIWGDMKQRFWKYTIFTSFFIYYFFVLLVLQSILQSAQHWPKYISSWGPW